MNKNKNIKKIVRKNASFFFWGMRFLPKAKREAMYTLYVFFRHIEGIIDRNMPATDKIELIKAWREEFDNIYDKKIPLTDIGRKIYKNCMRFKLPKAEFLRLIDSLAMDIPTPLRAPGTDDFLTYCRGISGTPCNLSLRVLGCEDEQLIEELSAELGSAIKITSILRDLREDVLAGHLYIPAEFLDEAGISSHDPVKVVTDKNLFIARQALADKARQMFGNTYVLIGQLEKMPAGTMLGLVNLYKRYFDIMDRRGWEIISPKPNIGIIFRLSLILKSFIWK